MASFEDESGIWVAGGFTPIRKDWYSEPNLFDDLQFINRGGFGTCFSARHASGMKCALKFFDYDETSVSDPAWVDMEITRSFESNEISGMAQLLGVFFDTEQGFLTQLFGIRKLFKRKIERQKVLVMELLEGGEVLERVAQNTTFGERDVSIILESVSRTLEQLHCKRRINPDFKLENLVFSDRDPSNLEVKLIDLGQVRILPEGQQEIRLSGFDQTLGTLKFLAPESRSRHQPTYSPKSDVWQIGCAVYIMACGYFPFSNMGRKEQHFQYFLNNCSVTLQDLLSKMLNTDPTQRCSVYDILNHPFITKRSVLPEDSLGPEYVARIRALQIRKRFRGLLQACADNGRRQRLAVLDAGINAGMDMSSIAAGLDSGVFLMVRELFMQCCGRDVSRPVTRDILKRILTQCGSLGALTHDSCLDIFDPLNRDEIFYKDFIVGLTAFRENPIDSGPNPNPNENKLTPRMLFDILDLNTDGELTLEELKPVLGVILQASSMDSVTSFETMIEELFDVLDVDGDKRVSMAEFTVFVDRNCTTTTSAIGLKRELSQPEAMTTEMDT